MLFLFPISHDRTFFLMAQLGFNESFFIFFFSKCTGSRIKYTELPRRWQKDLRIGTVVVGNHVREREGGSEMEMAEMISYLASKRR